MLRPSGCLSLLRRLHDLGRAAGDDALASGQAGEDLGEAVHCFAGTDDALLEQFTLELDVEEFLSGRLEDCGRGHGCSLYLGRVERDLPLLFLEERDGVCGFFFCFMARTLLVDMDLPLDGVGDARALVVQTQGPVPCGGKGDLRGEDARPRRGSGVGLTMTTLGRRSGIFTTVG